MQTRDQVKNWKVVATVASAAALGLSGLAVASPDEPTSNPPAINLDDQRRVDSTIVTAPDGSFTIVPSPAFEIGDDSFDSPLASGDLDTFDDGVDATADDSPDDSPAATVAPDADDSPEDSPADSPDDSPAGTTAADPDDSPDDSPDGSLDT